MDETKIGYQVGGGIHSYENSKDPESYYRSVLDNLPINPNQRVLDIASGAGNEADFLRRRYMAKVFEMDITETAFRANSNRARNFVLADYSRLPYADGIFNFIHCKDALLHFQDTNTFFREVHRVLLPGGIVTVTLTLVPEFDIPRPFFTIDFGTKLDGVVMERKYFNGGNKEYQEAVSSALAKLSTKNILAISPPYYPKKQSEISSAARECGLNIVKNFNEAEMWQPKDPEINWGDGSRSIMTFKKEK